MIIPPLCPNPKCQHHHYSEEGEESVFYNLKGTYHTKVLGRVQRFQCKSCGIYFGERTTDIDYYAKKTLPNNEIRHDQNSSASLSAIARKYGCRTECIQNRIDRLARNNIAMHARLRKELVLREDLVADGFESFDCSQYFPNNINIVVGKESQFQYEFTHSTIRRKGRMTKEQRAKRDLLEKSFKAKPSAIRDAFEQALRSAIEVWDEKEMPHLVLETDQHKAYPLAIQRIDRLVEAMREGRFTHITHSSKIIRNTSNPLFPVNYFDREIRKDLANHHRETKCFTRNVSNGLMRYTVYVHYHNYLKGYRIKLRKHQWIKHAMVAGIDPISIQRELKRCYRHRAFISKQDLTPEERRIWLKEHPNPLSTKPNYVPKYVRASLED